MKRLKLFSFTLLGLLLIASLSFFTSACQQEEAVGARTSSLDEALLADLAGRYYQPATVEQLKADGEMRIKLTRVQSDRLLDKLHEERVGKMREWRDAQVKEWSAKPVEGNDADKRAPLTDNEFAEVLEEAGAAHNRKKQANKEAFEKFNRNFFSLTENEKLQLGSFQSLGLKPIAEASARTACNAYCTKATCPTLPGSSQYATIYSAGITAIISGTTPSTVYGNDWKQAVDYCAGDCDFVSLAPYFSSSDTYVCGKTQPGGELLGLFGGPGARLAYGYLNYTQCGAYTSPNNVVLGARRCKIYYATTNVNFIATQLRIDIGYFYRFK
ncbi:MAG: hypothetical protein AVDCRST_MAG56-2394 [uncultured Cytophagales bacterium]|uniref:Uncharacterized protein n=1 Tax=uncultured Cytophagales bacterium TaxID=158755 RepID=A0A6J4H4W8_9SPHI|nr:MAG: hypothetical protein AVDCRST_MAG56-2394 [uncultured Cytophagales bacterium]